jgi:hypothetical protein
MVFVGRLVVADIYEEFGSRGAKGIVVGNGKRLGLQYIRHEYNPRC